MKLITADEMRKLDRRAIETFGIAGKELMRAAGAGLADAVSTLAENHRLGKSSVLFAAGPGNNGGDAFAAAYFLHKTGYPVECWLTMPEDHVKGDALIHFGKMKRIGVPFKVLKTAEEWQQAAVHGTDAEIIVDGLLGTGGAGPLRGAVAEAVRFVDAQAERALVVAVDVPSAMAVRADLTVTMGLPKIDCIDPEYIDSVGNLEVVDIGIPSVLLEAAEGDPKQELIHPSDLAPLFSRRPWNAHKGTFGHLLCIGGSKGFSGAITLACASAIRSGAGRISALVPEDIHALTASVLPEVMIHSNMPSGKWSAILAGPGMGRTHAVREQALHLLKNTSVPLILDADVLMVLADDLDAVAQAECPVVLTPHPGECATLMKLNVKDIQADRPGMARMMAEQLKSTVVLKGAGTMVAAPGRPLAVNLTGNPGMAAGGIGDVLAGLIAGLSAQGIGTFQAACAAVWMHGRAGDLAAAEKAQACLSATDLIEKLPEVFRELSCR